MSTEQPLLENPLVTTINQSLTLLTDLLNQGESHKAAIKGFDINKLRQQMNDLIASQTFSDDPAIDAAQKALWRHGAKGLNAIEGYLGLISSNIPITTVSEKLTAAIQETKSYVIEVVNFDRESREISPTHLIEFGQRIGAQLGIEASVTVAAGDTMNRPWKLSQPAATCWQAVTEIVRNAKKYGASKVEIQATATHDQLTLTFTDNGPGIDPSRLSEVNQALHEENYSLAPNNSVADSSGQGLQSIRKSGFGLSLHARGDLTTGTVLILEVPLDS